MLDCTEQYGCLPLISETADSYHDCLYAAICYAAQLFHDTVCQITCRAGHQSYMLCFMQVACCNIHFIDEGVFRMNTSQTVACFKEDFSPVDLPRKLSLCTWTLLPEFPEVLVVPDALQDIRSSPVTLPERTCNSYISYSARFIDVCRHCTGCVLYSSSIEFAARRRFIQCDVVTLSAWMDRRTDALVLALLVF